MPVGIRAAVAVLVLTAAAACSPRTLLKQFEYEEEMYLSLDGSATMIVNASIPALVALRGLPLNPDPGARFDRVALRRLLEAPGVDVTRVSRPWRRHGRRFVQIRLNVSDIRDLSAVPLFAWSDYHLDRRPSAYEFRQVVHAPTGPRVTGVGWDGSELVGFRVHLPSRIVYHNAPSKTVERGNILSWEQPMRDRMAGVPIEMDVRMETQSILYRTLFIFGVAAAAAIALLAAAIYWVWLKGRAAQATEPGPVDPA